MDRALAGNREAALREKIDVGQADEREFRSDGKDSRVPSVVCRGIHRGKASFTVLCEGTGSEPPVIGPRSQLRSSGRKRAQTGVEG